MKFRNLLFMLGILFTSCVRERIQGILFLRDELLLLMMDISAYITGVKKKFDKDGNIIGEIACARNFSKAYKLFDRLKQNLEAYPKIVKSPISKTNLQEIHQKLIDLQKVINTLPDGSNKTQFLEKYSHLNQYLSSLIDKKGV